MASVPSSSLTKVLVKLDRLDLTGNIEVDTNPTKCGASFDVFRGRLRVGGKGIAVRQLRVHLRSQRKYSKVRTLVSESLSPTFLTCRNRELLVNFSYGSRSGIQTSSLSLDTLCYSTTANFLCLSRSGWKMGRSVRTLKPTRTSISSLWCVI